MQKTVVPPRIVPPKPRVVALSGHDAGRTVRTVPIVRRVAAGALMTAVVVGGTVGVTLAASRDDSGGVPAVVRPSEVTPTPTPGTSAKRVQDVAFNAGSVVYTWPSASSTKSTAVRITDPGQGVVRRAGTVTRIAAVWAVAAALVTAGILAGSVLRHRRGLGR